MLWQIETVVLLLNLLTLEQIQTVAFLYRLLLLQQIETVVLYIIKIHIRT